MMLTDFQKIVKNISNTCLLASTLEFLLEGTVSWVLHSCIHSTAQEKTQNRPENPEYSKNSSQIFILIKVHGILEHLMLEGTHIPKPDFI